MLAVALAVLACSGGGDGAPPTTTARPAPGPSAADRAAQGGDATVEVFGRGAFAQPVPGLDVEQRRFFAVGNNFFNDNWVTAPASTTSRDGLGPLFNAQSCSSCHFRDGRARPPSGPDDPERGLLVRLGVPGPDGTVDPHPVFGEQLQDRAVNGVPAEGSIVITTTERPGTYPDGTPYSLSEPRYQVLDAEGLPLGDDVVISPRVAPAMFGMGLLEGVPADAVVAAADPDDADGDGISGRAPMVVDRETGDLVLGRFGWKAAEPTVEDQGASAFRADIGITSSLRPEQPCTAVQEACRAGPHGGDPEIPDERLGRVTFYTRTLAVPARRDVGTRATDRGEDLFTASGCAACHTARLETGPSDIAALDGQAIRPWTDLLLHDMGPGLADGRPEGDATGTEWRTPPLWGLGLLETVNGHTRLLHDGRARSVEEAVLWHGGEAEAARDRFTALPAADRDAVLAFLASL